MPSPDKNVSSHGHSTYSCATLMETAAVLGQGSLTDRHYSSQRFSPCSCPLVQSCRSHNTQTSEELCGDTFAGWPGPESELSLSCWKLGNRLPVFSPSGFPHPCVPPGRLPRPAESPALSSTGHEGQIQAKSRYRRGVFIRCVGQTLLTTYIPAAIKFVWQIWTSRLHALFLRTTYRHLLASLTAYNHHQRGLIRFKWLNRGLGCRMRGPCKLSERTLANCELYVWRHAYRSPCQLECHPGT